jgi:SAM-dependent methyltransferase
MSSYSRQQLEAWLKTIEVPPQSKVLDIGGSQLSIKGRTKSWDVEEYRILDLENPHECKLKPQMFWDMNKDLSIGSWPSGWIDVAFCLEVMEYIYNPFQALKNISYLLKNGGNLYISFHTLYGLHNPVGEDCLRYTKYGISKLLKESGFEIEEIIPREITPEGKIALTRFYHYEGMRILRNDETFDCGYLVKAKKI